MIEPANLCDHGEAYYRFEMDQTADEIILRLQCDRCGAEQVERRPPETALENLRCLSQALRDVRDAVLGDLKSWVERIT